MTGTGAPALQHLELIGGFTNKGAILCYQNSIKSAEMNKSKHFAGMVLHCLQALNAQTKVGH